ncbi:TonB-dependent receptor domain-containing protein [Luteimonas terrae]|uniref:Iron complex outermembrane receptor protein n=1 Tax=Luteimonas terrae TaxID=1530191 RepID=A0ABU1XSQ2_9GAMM|nr:TonB-dependent receptor [Luteimonas terrae]MDR7191789.1 iron complex outermembrane receptor protein [Luteimonas terrae]
MKTRLLSSAVASILLAPLGAFAQDTSSSTPVELDELVVVGERAQSPLAALPMSVLRGDELARRRQGGLGETLAGLPGVHLDSFGGGASRPVIRGQTLPRIEILSDGATLFDAASVSPDHAITTDPLLLDAIEVIRGPAAVIYGGNAMNGAVNLIDSRIPKEIPRNGLSGGAEVRLGSGNREKAGVGRVTAGSGQFAVHAEVARHHSDDYDIPGGQLQDSFADGSTGSLGASWITDRGYIGIAHTRQESEYGLPGHSHTNGVCHTHGIDLHCEAHDSYEDPFGSSDEHTARIQLRNARTDVRADYTDPFPGFRHLRLRLSSTDYRHDEIDGPALFSRYTNDVEDGRIDLTHKPLWGFTGTFGVQYTDGTFSGLNVNNLHVEFPANGYALVPPYTHVTRSRGVFLSEHRAFGAFALDIALRKDWRTINAPAPGFRHSLTPAYQALFEGWYGPDWEQVLRDEVTSTYTARNPEARQNPFSASVGGTWNLDDGYAIALSLGRTQRAPSVRELYAYGNNLATNSYEVGLVRSRGASPTFPANRPDLLETTRSADLTFRRAGGPVEFEVGLFHQDVDDYVFARLIETEFETGVPHNYLLYTAADAKFTGVDGQVSVRLNDDHRLTLLGDYVRADLRSEDDNLPRIPPGRWGVRHEWSSGPYTLDAEYFRTSSQNRIASYETKTGGYDMLNATFAYRLELTARHSAEFYIRATNLLNETAYVHTSFVKEQSPMRGRSMVVGARYTF